MVMEVTAMEVVVCCSVSCTNFSKTRLFFSAFASCQTKIEIKGPFFDHRLKGAKIVLKLECLICLC